jgi:general stress protein 26
MGEQEKLCQLLKGFDTAMLITLGQDNSPHGRPMHIVDAEEDGTLWFASPLHSGKVDEIQDDDRIGATMQSARRFVSLTGHARVIRDRAKIKQLWSEAWRPWFPNGPDDTDIALIRLMPTAGEYWDMSGIKGIRYLIKAAQAVLQKERPSEVGLESHGTV